MSYRPGQNNALLEGPILGSLLKLAIPVVLATLLQSGYQLTDAFWVGRLGGTGVAAVSVSFPITFLMIALGAGLAIAGSTLIAQNMGARNFEAVNHIAAQTLLMVAATSAVLGAIGFFVAPIILRAMGVDDDVFPGALMFMRWSFVGLVFVFGFTMYQAIMRGIGEVKTPLAIVAGTVLLNFLLDPLFIFGWGPIPASGVAGAAIATFGTQSLAMIIGVALLLSGRFQIHLHVRDFAPDVAFIRRAFTLGFPASIEQSMRALGLTVMTFLVASFGTTTIASYGVGGNVLGFVIIPALGLSLATSTLVGQNIGAGKVERAAAIARLSATISFVVLTTVGFISYLGAFRIAAFFVPKDTAVIQEGGRFLRIVSLSFGFMGVQLAFAGVFRAAGKMTAAMTLAVISQWVLQFPIAYMLSKHTSLGATGIWYAFPVANVGVAILALAWFLKGDWKQGKLTVSQKQTDAVTEEILAEEGVHGV
jgi:putative MATE family efflux protein